MTDEERRPEYLGYLMSSNGLAYAFGPGLGGGLSTFGTNVPILVNAGLCIASGLLAAAYLPEGPAPFGLLNRKLVLRTIAGSPSLKT